MLLKECETESVLENVDEVALHVYTQPFYALQVLLDRLARVAPEVQRNPCLLLVLDFRARKYRPLSLWLKSL